MFSKITKEKISDRFNGKAIEKQLIALESIIKSLGFLTLQDVWYEGFENALLAHELMPRFPAMMAAMSQDGKNEVTIEDAFKRAMATFDTFFPKPNDPDAFKHHEKLRCMAERYVERAILYAVKDQQDMPQDILNRRIREATEQRKRLASTATGHGLWANHRYQDFYIWMDKPLDCDTLHAALLKDVEPIKNEYRFAELIQPENTDAMNSLKKAAQFWEDNIEILAYGPDYIREDRITLADLIERVELALNTAFPHDEKARQTITDHFVECTTNALINQRFALDSAKKRLAETLQLAY